MTLSRFNGQSILLRIARCTPQPAFPLCVYVGVWLWKTIYSEMAFSESAPSPTFRDAVHFLTMCRLTQEKNCSRIVTECSRIDRKYRKW